MYWNAMLLCNVVYVYVYVYVHIYVYLYVYVYVLICYACMDGWMDVCIKLSVYSGKDGVDPRQSLQLAWPLVLQPSCLPKIR